MCPSASLIPLHVQNGFVNLARQTGVTHYAWAILDQQPAQQIFDTIDEQVRRWNLPPVRNFISMGAGLRVVGAVRDGTHAEGGFGWLRLPVRFLRCAVMQGIRLSAYPRMPCICPIFPLRILGHPFL